MRFFLLGGVLTIAGGAAFSVEKLSPTDLPDVVKVRKIQDLEEWLKQVEQTVSDNLDEQDNIKIVRNTTLSLQNYLEDACLAKQRKAVLYPWAIYHLLTSDIGEKKFSAREARNAKEHLSAKLLNLEKTDQYVKVTRLRRQPSQQKKM